jgi:hypothetical protein
LRPDADVQRPNSIIIELLKLICSDSFDLSEKEIVLGAKENEMLYFKYMSGRFSLTNKDSGSVNQNSTCQITRNAPQKSTNTK